MIEIVQAGQAGKTNLLFDMHRLRARVFKDMMGWDVKVDQDGLETDAFDLPDTVYLLALNKAGRVVGSWRMLPTTGPTMIRDLWPQFIQTLPMPSDPDVWEVSRFAVHVPEEDPEEAARQTQQAIGEMFCALTEICMRTGIREIYTLYDARIAKVIDRIDCQPVDTSVELPINDMMCRTGAFVTDQKMLKRLRDATGIQESMTADIELPPVLADRIAPSERERTNA
jgi:acyl homoserine lactone synthase